MKTPITKIIPFSAVDGPGNRSVVFVQGCNFFCGYCHNPETRQMCNNCGECVAACPAGALAIKRGKISWDSGKCIWCDACINTCRYSANPRIRLMTPAEVLDEIRAQLPFIRGYTVSGGECGLYPDFLLELMSLSRPMGLNAMLDANGHNPLNEKYVSVIEACDGMMLDIKAFDRELHREITGHPNEMVLATARKAARMGKLYELRTVCIPGKTDAEACITGMADMLGDLRHDVGYKLIAFRNIGVKGEYAEHPEPGSDWMQGLGRLAMDCGFRNVTVID